MDINRRFRNILVGLDGQDPGFHALGEAIRLAQWSKGQVTAVAVNPLYEGDLSLIGVQDIRDLVAGSGQSVCRQALDMASSMGLPIAVECRGGNPDEVIAELAGSGTYDLLVLGGSQRRSALGLFQGRLTAAIIGKCAIAVLVVPFPFKIGWQKLLLIDDAHRHNQGVVAWTAALAATYGAQLSVLVVSADDQAAAVHGQRFGLAAVAVESITAASIRDRVVSDHIDMIIVSKASKGRLALRKRYLLAQILNHSPCPTLIAATPPLPG